MLKKLIPALVPALMGASVLRADVPRVVTDIPPIHSLVALVMQGVGTPDLLIRTSASVHDHSMRPSDAKMLENAELVFWVGPELTPWLEKSIDVVAGKAEAVELIEARGTRTLQFREGEAFASADEHEDEHHGDESDDHDEAGHQSHEHAHDHDGLDPHAWLDPENGKVWLDAIAEKLAAADPQNADLYARNAEQAKSEIDALATSIMATLAPHEAKDFVVYHDAFQYFEARFGHAAAGAIAAGDAVDPGPARVSAIQDLVRQNNVTCVLSEPQARRSLVDTVFEKSDGKVALIDPAGTDLEFGPGLYSELLGSLAKALSECMS